MSTATAEQNGKTRTDERPASLSPFGEHKPAVNAAAESDRQRSIAEVLAALEIARRNPRDQAAAMDRILTACTRPTLAEVATYAYARGGTEITGPSIRLAEAIAQAWGNMQFGIRELEQRRGESTVEAFAWDVESNTRRTMTFQVKHERHTRSGVTQLADPRDIYEMVANQGSRRVRACILAIVPGDVVEAAVKQCEITLRAKIEITSELLDSLVTKFGKHGVSRKMLEAKIQRRLDTITPALVVNLGKIYNALEDGVAVAGDFFDLTVDQEAPKPAGDAAPKTRADQLKERLNGQPPAEPAPSGDDGELTYARAAAHVQALDAAAATRFIKDVAKQRGLDAKALEAVVETAGGWQKKNAVVILEGIFVETETPAE